LIPWTDHKAGFSLKGLIAPGSRRAAPDVHVDCPAALEPYAAESRPERLAERGVAGRDVGRPAQEVLRPGCAADGCVGGGTSPTAEDPQWPVAASSAEQLEVLHQVVDVGTELPCHRVHELVRREVSGEITHDGRAPT